MGEPEVSQEEESSKDDSAEETAFDSDHEEELEMDDSAPSHSTASRASSYKMNSLESDFNAYGYVTRLRSLRHPQFLHRNPQHARAQR